MLTLVFNIFFGVMVARTTMFQVLNDTSIVAHPCSVAWVHQDRVVYGLEDDHNTIYDITGKRVAEGDKIPSQCASGLYFIVRGGRPVQKIMYVR